MGHWAVNYHATRSFIYTYSYSGLKTFHLCWLVQTNSVQPYAPLILGMCTNSLSIVLFLEIQEIAR